jgi:hypothetical protein
MLEKKRVDADLAAEYLLDIAEALRADANNPEYLKRAYARRKRQRESASEHERRKAAEGVNRGGALSYAGDERALTLAAEVLEKVADAVASPTNARSASKAGRVDLGRIIRGGSKSQSLPQFEAVAAVLQVTLDSGRSLSRTQAYDKAAELLGWNDADGGGCERVAKAFRAYEKFLQNKLDWFAQGKRKPV